MKKVMNLLKRQKRKALISEIESDAVPESPRNIPRHKPNPKELYTNFKVDDCCSQTVQNTKNSADIDVESNVSEESLNNGDNATGINSIAQVMPLEEAQEVRNSLQNHLKDNISESDLPSSDEETPESQILSVPDSLSIQSDENFNQINTSNALELETIDTQKGLPSGCVQQKLEREKKVAGNTYVIKISNSTHFHIGSKKTINYPSVDDSNCKTKQVQLDDITEKILALQNNMLDIKEPLSDDDLLQISLCIQDKWKEFARNLGVDESTICELEELNGRDYNLIVYDILKQYLHRYPNTTVGFMISILRKSDEKEAINKLMQKR